MCINSTKCIFLMLFSKCNLEEKPKIYLEHNLVHLGLFPSFFENGSVLADELERTMLGFGEGVVSNDDMSND